MANNYKDGWIIATLAVMVPIIMMFVIIVPIYLGALIGLHFIYDGVIWSVWSNYDAVIYTYQQLYEQFEAYPSLTFWNFLAPKFACLTLGIILSLAFGGLFVNYVRGVFRYD